MRDIYKPLLWKRSFLAWADLLLAITCIVIAINSNSIYVVMLEFFIAGAFFQLWFFDNIYQSQRKLIDDVLALCKRIMKNAYPETDDWKIKLLKKYNKDGI